VARYEYRRLEVGWEDLGPIPADRLRLHDSAQAEPITLTRDAGEGAEAFRARRCAFLLEYLNALGRDGWRVLYYAPAVVRTPAAGVTLIADWPGGTHFLAREVTEEPEPA
jgi:hypothetical protein